MDEAKSDRGTTAETTAGPARRILVVSPWASRWSLGRGAGVSDDYHFIRVVARRGYDLHFLAPKGESPRPVSKGLASAGEPRAPSSGGSQGHSSDLAPGRITLHTYPDFFRATASWPVVLRRILWPALFTVVVTPKLVALARRIQPDFILGHSHYSALPCFAARRLLGIPAGVKLFGVMDLVHTEWPRWKYYFKNLEQIAALKVPQDVWIILDDGTRGREAAMRHGVPAERIRFLPNGIDVEWADRSFDRNVWRERLGVDERSVAVLFLARLVPSKRPEAFVEAARLVLERTARRVVFVLAGDGPSRDGCERLARSLGLAEAFRFTGAVEHARVPELMAASDIFVSTSRLTNAAIPTCEAMVCALPVVAFDVGSTRDVVADGATGFVVPDGDIASLAEAIVRLAEDEGLRRRLGEEARKTAKKTFTGWEARIAEELAIVEALVRERSRRR